MRSFATYCFASIGNTREALEQFDGDGSQLAGIEAQLQTCVELKQEETNSGISVAGGGCRPAAFGCGGRLVLSYPGKPGSVGRPMYRDSKPSRASSSPNKR